MKGDNIVKVVTSPAFTILIGTVCFIAIVKYVPPMIITYKNMYKKN